MTLKEFPRGQSVWEYMWIGHWFHQFWCWVVGLLGENNWIIRNAWEEGWGGGGGGVEPWNWLQTAKRMNYIDKDLKLLILSYPDGDDDDDK